jgi:hypothetical protein
MRLGYDRARTLIKHYTGLHLHQLRNSALTHDAENDTSTPMPLARSRHASVRLWGIPWVPPRQRLAQSPRYP